MFFRQNKINPGLVIAFSATFFVTFSTVFSGDFSAFGFFAFFPAFLSAVFLRVIFKIRLTTSEGFSFLAMSFLFLVVMAANLSSISAYYFSFLFAILFIFVISVIERQLGRIETAYFCFAILMITLFFAILALFQGSLRVSLVFGPNVFYRVIGYLYVLFLLTSILTGALRRYRLLLLVVAGLPLLTTGSRGAVPVLIFLVTLYIKSEFSHSRNGVIKASLVVLMASGLMLYYYETIKRVFWRLFYFDSENASLNTRWEFLNAAVHYWDSISLQDLLFGNGESQRVFSYYPHNIFLESFVYHGIFVAAIFLVFALVLIYALYLPLDGRCRNLNLALLFAPIFLGSLVSGSLFEAYSVAAVSVLLLVRTMSGNFRWNRLKTHKSFQYSRQIKEAPSAASRLIT